MPGPYQNDHDNAEFDKGFDAAIKEHGANWHDLWFAAHHSDDPYAWGYLEACDLNDDGGGLWDDEES